VILTPIKTNINQSLTKHCFYISYNTGILPFFGFALPRFACPTPKTIARNPGQSFLRFSLKALKGDISCFLGLLGATPPDARQARCKRPEPANSSRSKSASMNYPRKKSPLRPAKQSAVGAISRVAAQRVSRHRRGINGGMPAARSAGRAGRGRSPLRGAGTRCFQNRLIHNFPRCAPYFFILFLILVFKAFFKIAKAL
jgi:hypothetical protein